MKRIQRKRTKGWKMPENTVYVGRPTKWGNPYKPESEFGVEGCLIRYRLYIEECQRVGYLNLNELKGKDLACWCPLNKPCHADILIKILEGMK